MWNVISMIRTVTCTDDLVQLVKEETVLHSMNDKQIESGRCCGMKISVEKTKVMRISR